LLYRFDAVGSFEQVVATCAGKGEKMIQPMIDEITKMDKNEELWLFNEEEEQESDGERNKLKRPQLAFPLAEEEAIQFIEKAFKAAAEREISIGDGVEILSMRRESDGSITQRRVFFSLPSH
jgi:20S proteasome alpha/beta subunit